MLTKKTAQSIAEVCGEIEECEQALEILKGKESQEPCLIVRQNEVDDGICLSVSRDHALTIVKQILESRNTQYSDLNHTANSEVTQ